MRPARSGGGLTAGSGFISLDRKWFCDVGFAVRFLVGLRQAIARLRLAEFGLAKTI